MQNNGTTEPNIKNTVETALLESIPHLRDLSIRDGIQAWDANKWPIGNVSPVAKALDQWAETVAKYGIKIAPAETWGGGQVAQPAKMLGEDPLVNLEEIRDAMPHVELQCLYRGRQGFGFIPVSAEIQKAALEAAVKRGIKVVRIFDMMNDITNVETGIHILKEMQQTGKDVVIEGAISYISEPNHGKPRAWDLDDYGDYAIKLAKAGCNEIAIKNYAGVGDEEMLELIDTIRAKLNEAGYENMPINLHTHGQKPELLAKAIKAGASKVDVAFGKLAGGPSHSDIMDTLKLLMKQKECNLDDPAAAAAFEAHPIVKAMRDVEKEVAKQTDAFLSATGGKRLPPQSKENIEAYRMAGGALSDPWNRLNSPSKNTDGKPMLANDATLQMLNDAYATIGEPMKENKQISGYDSYVLGWLNQVKKRTISLNDIPTKKRFYEMILEECPALWEKAGRFNTVTPGAKILVDQAIVTASKKVTKEPILMTDYDNEYLNVVTGRFGKNMGMEKNIGDVKFRDAALMFRALKKINEAISAEVATPEGKIDRKTAGRIFAAVLGFKEPPVPLINNNGTFNLNDPSLERRLKQCSIEYFRDKIEEADLPSSLLGSVLAELTPGKSPDPTDGLAAGKQIIEDICEKKGIDIASAREKGARISAPDDLALLALVLRERQRGVVNNATITSLCTNHCGGRTQEPANGVVHVPGRHGVNGVTTNTGTVVGRA